MLRAIWTVRSFALALILLSLALTAQAQVSETRANNQPAGKISGQVRLPNGQPASEVLVTCDGFSGGLAGQTRTDRSGRFQFDNLGNAQFTVTVRQPGYLPVSESVELATTSFANIQIQLRPDPNAPPIESGSVIDSNIPAAAQKEFEKAEALMAPGKKEAIPEAILHYQQSLTIYPKFLQAQLKLGTAYMDMSDWEHAEQALKKTLELNPNAANALFALGEVYLRQKKDEDAEKVLLQGLQAEDRSAQGHLILARVYVDMAAKIKDDVQNRPFRAKAFDQVNASLKYDANSSLAHWIKGNLLVSVGRNVDAQHEFEEYVRLDPKGPWADKARTLIDRIKKVESAAKP